MKKAIVVLIALMACIGLTPNVHALMLTIDDGMNMVTVDDLDSDGWVKYSGKLDDMWVKISANGISAPLYGKPGSPSMHLSSVELSGSAAELKITLTDNFNAFNDVLSGFKTDFGGTAANEISLTTSLDGSTISALGPLGPGAFAATDSVSVVPTDPTNYMLALEATISHNDSSQITSFDADLNPVPEPGTLMLLGSGLAGVGFFRRRKKK